MIHLSWKRCQLCIITNKECALFGNMYSGRHENIKIPGGQYMSAETETQYNPQYGIRRTIFSDEYDFLTKIESVCVQ